MFDHYYRFVASYFSLLISVFALTICHNNKAYLNLGWVRNTMCLVHIYIYLSVRWWSHITTFQSPSQCIDTCTAVESKLVSCLCLHNARADICYLRNVSGAWSHHHHDHTEALLSVVHIWHNYMCQDVGVMQYLPWLCQLSVVFKESLRYRRTCMCVCVCVQLYSLYQSVCICSAHRKRTMPVLDMAYDRPRMPLPMMALLRLKTDMPKEVLPSNWKRHKTRAISLHYTQNYSHVGMTFHFALSQQETTSHVKIWLNLLFQGLHQIFCCLEQERKCCK